MKFNKKPNNANEWVFAGLTKSEEFVLQRKLKVITDIKEVIVCFPKKNG